MNINRAHKNSRKCTVGQDQSYRVTSATVARQQLALASVLTQTADADAAAGWAAPIGVKQCFLGVLIVAIAKAGTAELTTHASTRGGATHGLRVESLLATLVTTGSVLTIPHLQARLLTHLAQLLLRDLFRCADLARGRSRL